MKFSREPIVLAMLPVVPGTLNAILSAKPVKSVVLPDTPVAMTLDVYVSVIVVVVLVLIPEQSEDA